MRRPLALLLVAAAGLLAGGRDARAQRQDVPRPGERCVIEFEPAVTDSSRFQLIQLPSGNYNVFQGGGVLYRCQGQDVTLAADSAEYYGDPAVLYLIGNVRYREPRVEVDADRMTYYRLEDRLVAEGNVRARDLRGSTMRGPRAEYFRANPTRPQRLVATGRPTLELVETDSLGRPAEPVNVIADRITTIADSLVYAGGNVNIRRPDFDSVSDSAFLDSGREFGRLVGNPKVTGRGERPFRLTARLVDVFSRNRELERVLATTDARVVSEDTEVLSDSLDLRVRADRLQEAHAWGPSRARAVSPQRTIVADSLHVVMPDQEIRRVTAVGEALAETEPDTTRIRTKERDWLRGDTIVARFDSIPEAPAPAAGDTASARRSRIRELVALGGARSFYHLVPQDTTNGGEAARQPAVNYVVGDTITVSFEAGEVDTVAVTGNAHGVYVESEREEDRRRREGGAVARPRGSRP